MTENKRAFELMELTNVGDGRAVELFDRAIREILKDLSDEDKNPTEKRSLEVE